MWRALNEALPTKHQLLKIRVEVNCLCPVCNGAQEDTIHAFVLCPFATACWNRLGFMKYIGQPTSLQQWLQAIMQHCSKEEVQKVVMVIWAVWKNRNNVIWNQKGMEPSDVLVSTNLFFNQWKSAQDKTFDNYLGFMTQADGKEHWELPTEGKVKINTDAAIFNDSRQFSYAFIARDHRGDLVEAVSNCKQGSIDPLLAEAIGVRDILSWVKGKGWQAVELETDCLALIQVIRCSTINLSYLGRVVDECRNLLLLLQDRQITLSFVKRSANKVAHIIARHSSSLAVRRWIRRSVTPELSRVMLNDLKY